MLQHLLSCYDTACRGKCFLLCPMRSVCYSIYCPVMLQLLKQECLFLSCIKQAYVLQHVMQDNLFVVSYNVLEHITNNLCYI